jgi:hypothetical protein
MAKRKVKSQIANLTSDHRKSRIKLFSLHVGGIQDTIRKILMRATILLKPHLDWRSAHKVMGPQSCDSTNFENFGILIWKSWDKMPLGCGPRGEA